MIRRPPRSTRTYTLFPYTTLFRSTGTGGYTADLWLSTETPPPEPIIAWDYYSFTVGQDESVTVGLKGLADPNVRLSIVDADDNRSEEHTSELQSLMRISYAVFCLNKKNTVTKEETNNKIESH